MFIPTHQNSERISQHGFPSPSNHLQEKMRDFYCPLENNFKWVENKENYWFKNLQQSFKITNIANNTVHIKDLWRSWWNRFQNNECLGHINYKWNEKAFLIKNGNKKTKTFVQLNRIGNDKKYDAQSHVH